MGGGIPLVALGVRPPDIANPIDQYGKTLTLRSMLEQQKLIPGQLQAQQEQLRAAQLENQQRQYQLGATQALNRSYQNAITKDASGLPQINSDALSKSLAASGYGAEIPSVLEGINKFNKSLVDLQESHGKLQSQLADLSGSASSAIKAANYDPKIAHTILDIFPSSPQVDQLRQTVDSDPIAFRQLVDSAIAQSPAQQKMANERKIAEIRAGGSGAEPLTADQINQLNQTLGSRYQVLNPGKSLPAQFALPANATQKDYDRIDKALEQTEKATGTKAQQDTANAMRRQTESLAAQSRADAEEKQGQQPVTGTDASGNDVLVSAADAKKMGLTNVMKADADIVNKSTAARHWLQLADKPGSEDGPADKMGILQLIDKMDKEGKLGTVASRWNDFLSGKVGAGDPDYTALRAKMGLSSTKLMQAHVGSRGGSFMMEHFEDLANAKKMDADNLRAGVLSELNYMQDVAMLPQKAGGGAQSGRKTSGPPAGATMRVPGSDGKMHWSDGKRDLGVVQ